MKNKILFYILIATLITAIIWLPIILETKENVVTDKVPTGNATVLVFNKYENWAVPATDELYDLYRSKEVKESLQILEFSDYKNIKLFPSLSDLISFDNDEQIKMVEALNAQNGKLPNN